jgi:hypothetical protein
MGPKNENLHPRIGARSRLSNMTYFTGSNSMPCCSDNDRRWSHGQAFTLILDMSDKVYEMDDFLGAEMGMQVDVGTDSHYVIWKFVKAIKNSVTKGKESITVVLLAKDPQRDANEKGSHGGPIRNSRKGPVAMFKQAVKGSSNFDVVNVPLDLMYDDIQQV